MANLAEAVDGDIHKIAKAMGMDGRISPKFLHPGPGYGGSCFPKDTRALVATGRKYGADMSLIDAAVKANAAQKERMALKLEKLFETAGTPGLKGKTVAVLGLAFKAETDDIRETPSLKSCGQAVEIRCESPGPRSEGDGELRKEYEKVALLRLRVRRGQGRRRGCHNDRMEYLP